MNTFNPDSLGDSDSYVFNSFIFRIETIPFLPISKDQIQIIRSLYTVNSREILTCIISENLNFLVFPNPQSVSHVMVLNLLLIVTLSLSEIKIAIINKAYNIPTVIPKKKNINNKVANPRIKTQPLSYRTSSFL